MAAAAAAAPGKQLHLAEGHRPGARACIAWDVQGKALVTAGADARLLVHDAGGDSAARPSVADVLHQQPVTALCLAPGGRTLATASLDRTVKLYAYPGAKFEGNVTRFTLPVRSLAFSVTGGLLAAAGDDDGIKLISTTDNSIVRVLKGHEASVVSLSFDPKNDSLASVDGDGTVIIWSLSTGAELHRLRHAAPDVDVEEAGKNEVAWHPSGDVLAVPGHQFDVVMYDRDTAEVRFRLRGGHSTAIGYLAWSPNGKYLATVGQDRKVMLWDTESKQDLDKLKVAAQVTALAWNPVGNALAVIDVDGRFGVWKDAVPSHLPSPSDPQNALATISRDALLRFSDDDDDSARENSGSDERSEGLKFAGEEGEEILDEEDDEEDEEGEEEFSKFRVKAEVKSEKFRKEPNSSKEVSRVRQGSSSLHNVKREKGERNGAKESVGQQPCVHKPKPEKQGSFQPGSTRVALGTRRFLAYNMLGSITSFETNGIAHVEVEFHDTSRGHRMPAITDFSGFTMAALSDRGSVFANPQRGDKTPSTLIYRPCTSGASNSEWTMRFPLNEEVRAVAVGDRWAAAATSLNFLRIFSEAGLQRYVLSLAGPVVTLTSYRHQLAVITHAADPLECGDQVMESLIFDVRNQEKVLSGPLPLTPGAKLTWLGFTESGTLSSYDSKGVLRMFSKSYGGCWVPVFSSSSDPDKKGENLWVVGLDSTQIFCVKCNAPEVEPQVNPKPILSMVPYSMPLAHSDLGAADLENELSCRSLFLAEMRSKVDEAAARGDDEDDLDEDESRLLTMKAELDRCLVRLLAAACQGDKLTRALELATLLSLQKSLEGAVKVVTAMRLPSLAERLNSMLEQRRNSEKAATPTQSSRGLKAQSSPLSHPSFSSATNFRPVSMPARISSAVTLPFATHRTPAPKLNNVAANQYIAANASSQVREMSNSSMNGDAHKVEYTKDGNTASPPQTRNTSIDKGSISNTSEEIAPQVKSPTSFNPRLEENSNRAEEMIVPKETLPTEPPKTLNPFAKASAASSTMSSLIKQNGNASASEVSVLNSLKKMQKESIETDGKKKRKAKSNNSVPKSQRPPKAAKDAS